MTVTLPAQDLTPPLGLTVEVGRGTSGRARLACQRTSLDDHCPSLKSHDLGVGEGPGLHQESISLNPLSRGRVSARALEWAEKQLARPSVLGLSQLCYHAGCK